MSSGILLPEPTPMEQQLEFLALMEQLAKQRAAMAQFAGRVEALLGQQRAGRSAADDNRAQPGKWHAVAVTHAQQAFMCWERALTQPEVF